MTALLWVLACLAPPAAAAVAVWFGLAPPDDDELVVDWLGTHPKYAHEVDDVVPDWWPDVEDITARPAGRHHRPAERAA